MLNLCYSDESLISYCITIIQAGEIETNKRNNYKNVST